MDALRSRSVTSPPSGGALAAPWLAALGAAVLATAAACREDVPIDPGEGETVTTVRQIQTPRGPSDPPTVGSQVFLRSVVVSAYDGSPEVRARRERAATGEYYCVEETGYTGAIAVQDVEGGPFAGVSLFNPTVVPSHMTLGPGDLVDVRGQYLEFCLSGLDNHADSFCDAADTNRLTQLGRATVTKVGEATPPEPMDVRVRDLLDPERAEQLEGTLVRIAERLEVRPCSPTDSEGRPTCCVGDYDRYGNLSTTSGLALTNEYYTAPTGVTCFESLTGIVTWFGHATAWGSYSLSPRGPSDLVVPAGCRP